VGSSNREFYSSFGVPDDRIVMTPFSVDNTKFSWPDDVLHSKKASAFSRLDLDPSCPTLLFAGKLQDHKRPLDLLWAARRMVTPVNVIVIGDGALRSAVESEMAAIPTARLLGFVNQSELGLWYGLSDIVVVPSSTEPWGLVVNEAMAAGTVPVVSDRVGCAPDLVLPCGGAVYPVGDVKALARTLDEMLGDPAGIARASQAARSVVERFSIEATARGYEEAVHLLLTPSAAK
jgi:glycosyltransferase involved in cell wall biosynthesis